MTRRILPIGGADIITIVTGALVATGQTAPAPANPPAEAQAMPMNMTEDRMDRGGDHGWRGERDQNGPHREKHGHHGPRGSRAGMDVGMMGGRADFHPAFPSSTRTATEPSLRQISTPMSRRSARVTMPMATARSASTSSR